MNAKIDKLSLALSDAKTSIKTLKDELRSLKLTHKAELKAIKESTGKAVKEIEKPPIYKKVNATKKTKNIIEITKSIYKGGVGKTKLPEA